MNIVLDLDGVICDFITGYEKLFGGHVNLPELSLSKEQWKKIDNDTGFWLGLPIASGGKYLMSLGEVPTNYFILTSRNEKKTRSDTLVWLKRHDIGIADENVLFANPRAAKIEYLKRLAPLKFLDDSIGTVDVADTLRDVEATLMLQPYNGACALRYFPSMDVTNSVEKWLMGDYHGKRSTMPELSAQSRR